MNGESFEGLIIPGEKKVAGFRIDNTLGEKVASMDLSIRNNPYAQSYKSYVSEIEITGDLVSFDKYLM
jgi:hypothetical protein